MEDREIVALYWARSEDAIAETDGKYGTYCRYIAGRIAGDDEAESVVADTWLKCWNTIPPAEPDPLKGYVGMLCRGIACHALERRTAQKRSAETAPLDELAEVVSGEEDDAADTLALREALNAFVGGLPERTRRVFVRRYWYGSSVAETAAAYGMKESACAVLLLRTRRALRAFLEKEGFTL